MGFLYYSADICTPFFAGLSSFQYSVVGRLCVCLCSMATNWCTNCFKFIGPRLSLFLLCMYCSPVFCQPYLEEEINTTSDIAVHAGTHGMYIWLFIPWLLYLWDNIRLQYAHTIFKLLLLCLCSCKQKD